MINIFDYLIEPLHWFSKDIPIFDIEIEIDYLDTEERVRPNIIRTNKQYNVFKVQSNSNDIVTSFYIGRTLQNGKPKKETP